MNPPSLLRSAIATLLGGATLHAQSWTVVNLHPPGATGSGINAITGTRQAGYATVGGEGRAALWSGTAASFADLHPYGAIGATSSVINAITGTRQAGVVRFGGLRRAALWSGTTASFVDLHPGSYESVIDALSDTRQAGHIDTGPGGYQFTALWSGTADSFVNLYPDHSKISKIHALSGTRQAGYVIVFDGGARIRASLWSGTAGSHIDLNPLVATESNVYALSGNRQGGYAMIGGLHQHAALWSGTAASFVDLNPAGATASIIKALSGNRQAGSATIGGRTRAGLWSGTAASFVDLHAFLPARYSSSGATSIWTDGSTVLVGGVALNSSPVRTEAILWRYTPPRAPTLSIKGKKRITTSRPSLVVKGRAADADGNLSKVEVKAGKAKFKRAKGLASWRFTAKLRPGKNPVTARATDTTGRKSRNAKITIVRR